MSDVSSEKGDNVIVAVRVRPYTTEELQLGKDDPFCTLETDDSHKCIFVTSETTKARNGFSYNYVLWSMPQDDGTLLVTQEDVYTTVGAPTVDHFVNGYNTCIFAYGQTSSGKTYTMMGDVGTDEVGIIPRACDALFEKMELRTLPTQRHSIEVNYFEIYNERVNCLLEPNAVNLRVREDPLLGPFVEGLTSVPVKDFYDVRQLINLGNMSRHTASTKLNNSSSRSHAIFAITLLQQEFMASTGELKTTRSKMNLVDLAGSERTKKSGTTGTTLHEGIYINKSLTVLALVIKTLSEGNAHYVNFRDSTLTWILKENLGGNSKTVMLATVSPSQHAYDETLSTLRYAERVKSISMHAVINETSRMQQMSELKRELARLQGEMERHTRVAPDGTITSGMEGCKISSSESIPYLLLVHSSQLNAVDIVRFVPESVLFICGAGRERRDSVSSMQPHNRSRRASVSEGFEKHSSPKAGLPKSTSTARIRRGSVSKGQSVLKALADAQKEREIKEPSPPNQQTSDDGKDNNNNSFPPPMKRRGTAATLNIQEFVETFSSVNASPRSDRLPTFVVGYHPVEHLIKAKDSFITSRSRSAPCHSSVDAQRRNFRSQKEHRTRTQDDIKYLTEGFSLVHKSWLQVAADAAEEPGIGRMGVPVGRLLMNELLCCIVRHGNRLSLVVPNQYEGIFPKITVDCIPVDHAFVRLPSSCTISIGENCFRIVQPTGNHISPIERRGPTKFITVNPAEPLSPLSPIRVSVPAKTTKDVECNTNPYRPPRPPVENVGVNTNPKSAVVSDLLRKKASDTEEELRSALKIIRAMDKSLRSKQREDAEEQDTLALTLTKVKNDILMKETLASESGLVAQSSILSVRQLQQENASLRSALAAAQHENECLNNTRQRLEMSELHQLRRAIKEAEEKLLSLNTSIADHTQLHSGLIEQVASLQNSRAAMQDVISSQKLSFADERMKEEKWQRQHKDAQQQHLGQIELLLAKESSLHEQVEKLRTAREELTLRDLRYVDTVVVENGVKYLQIPKETHLTAQSVCVRVGQDVIALFSAISRGARGTSAQPILQVPISSVANVTKKNHLLTISLKPGAAKVSSITLHVEDSHRRGVLMRAIGVRCGQTRFLFSVEREDAVEGSVAESSNSPPRRENGDM
eukprot:PhF_6_TR918/c0_g1_i2/m.1548/K10392/KIF1; kinesin family member 1